MTVRRMLAEMDSAEIAEWMAFASVEGLGDERAEWRAARVMALHANIHRAKGVEPFNPSDFVMRLDEEPEKQEPIFIEDKDAMSEMMSAALFGLPLNR